MARPAGMQSGDTLVVFLVALSIYWGNEYWDNTTHLETGNPPPGTPPPPVDTAPNWPAGHPVAPSEYPHTPPMSTLVNGAGGFDIVAYGSPNHYYGNYWSNLGQRDYNSPGNSWDTANSNAALALWPFISGWWGPQSPDHTNPVASPCSWSVVACGRTVDGSESSSFTFTLNNPLDSEYDYRGIALCFTPDDYAGDFYDNRAGGGTGAKSHATPYNGYFPATGSRDSENVSTHRNQSDGTTDVLRTLDGARPFATTWGTWPIRQSDYMWLADSTTPELQEPNPPRDLNNPDELLLNLIAYAGPTTFGDPTGVTVADLSVSPPADPLPILHREIWTKGSNTLMVHLSSTRPTSGHATTTDGDGIVSLTQRILLDNGGPIAADYPPLAVPTTPAYSENGLGGALTFRIRIPYVAPFLPAIPSRLATIVG